MKKILIIFAVFFCATSCSYYTYTRSSGCAVNQYENGYWTGWRHYSSSYAIATRSNEFVIYDKSLSGSSPSNPYIRVSKGVEAGKEQGWTVYKNCKIEYYDEGTSVLPLTHWTPNPQKKVTYGTVKIYHGKFENIVNGKTINVFVGGHKISGSDGFGISPRDMNRF